MTWTDFARILQRVLEQSLFVVGGTEITVSSVLTFVLVLAVTWWVSAVTGRVVCRAMERTGVGDHGSRATVRRLIHYLLLIFGIGVGLQIIGINLSSLFAAGAVVAVGIGFALQNVLQNFASGVILLAERSITEGDVLQAEGQIIHVERIGIRATIARTREDEQLIIPNSSLVQTTVKNYTLSDPLYRVRCPVGVSYDSDMKRVEEVLLEAGQRVEGRAPERDPVVLLLEFADSSVVWEVSIWGKDPWAARVTRSDLNKAIWWSLKEAGITIAYPQLDVHFDPPVERGLAATGE